MNSSFKECYFFKSSTFKIIFFLFFEKQNHLVKVEFLKQNTPKHPIGLLGQRRCSKPHKSIGISCVETSNLQICIHQNHAFHSVCILHVLDLYQLTNRCEFLTCNLRPMMSRGALSLFRNNQSTRNRILFKFTFDYSTYKRQASSCFYDERRMK